MPLTLEQLNAAGPDDFARLLEGTYEHSPWIAREAWARRPFASLAALKQALVEAVHGAGRERQVDLVRAHPELAGKATIEFTIGSCGEVSRAAVVSRRGRVDAATDCVLRAMRAWRTPFRPAEPVTVEYPFSFSASM